MSTNSLDCAVNGSKKVKTEAERICENCGGNDAVMHNGGYYCRATHGTKPEHAEGERESVDLGLFGWAAQNNGGYYHCGLRERLKIKSCELRW